MASGQAWGEGWQQGSSAAAEQGQHKRNRQEQLQDEQRNQKISVYADLFHNDRISTAEYAHAVENTYHDAEPEKKMNLLRQAINHKKARQQHQQFLEGRQKNATEEQGIISGAKTGAQVQGDQDTAKTQAGITQKKATLDALKKLVPNATPQELEAATFSIFGASKATPSQTPKEYTSPDGKRRDWFRVGEQPEGWNATQGEAKPKQISPSVQYMNLTAKRILADKKQGPPLTDEESAQLAGAKGSLDEAGVARANAFAQAAAANNLIAVTDPETGMDTLITRQQAAGAAKSGSPFLAGAVSSPTGMDKKNQMLAQSALTQIDTMEKILVSDPSMTGPGSGQWTQFEKWIGSNSEDSQQFLAAATFMSEHGVGVFGGRNIHSIEDLKSLMGSLRTNPKALKAALEQARQTMTPWATAGGRLPAPKAAGGKGTAKGKVRVKLQDGRTGTIDENEFDAKTMTKVQ